MPCTSKIDAVRARPSTNHLATKYATPLCRIVHFDDLASVLLVDGRGLRFTKEHPHKYATGCLAAARLTLSLALRWPFADDRHRSTNVSP